MDTFDAIRGRRSIRRYRNEPIPESVLPALEESLLAAPSAGNLQARRFYFVSRRETLRRIAAATYGQNFIAEVPLAIVCCADLALARPYGKRGRTLYCLQDVAASIQNLLLAAFALGLGTVWVGAFDEKDVAKVLGLPASLRPLAIVPVGYPDERPTPPERVPTEDAVVRLS